MIKNIRLSHLVALAAIGIGTEQYCWAAASANTKNEKIKHENPAHADPVQELARLRSEAIAHYESGIGQKTALSLFSTIVEKFKANAADHFNLGLGYYKSNDLEKAVVSFKKSIELDSGLANPHYMLGLLALNMGENAELQALAHFTQAKNLAPASPSVHYQISRVNRELGNAEVALQSIVSTLGLDPYHTGALYQLYLYHQASGDKTKADDVFKEFSRLKKAIGRSRKEINPDEAELARPIHSETDAGRHANQSGSKKIEYTVGGNYEHAPILKYVWLDKNPSSLQLATLDADSTLAVYKLDKTSRLSAEKEVKLDIGKVSDIVTAVATRGGELSIFMAGSKGIHHIYDSKSGIGNSTLDTHPTASKKEPALISKKISSYEAASLNVIDIDHDGDVDIVADGFAMLLLNQGNGQFEETSGAAADIIGIDLTSLEPTFDASDLRNLIATDIVVSDRKGNRSILVDEMGGRYVAKAGHLSTFPGVRWTGIADMNNDGLSDILAISLSGLTVERNLGGLKFKNSLSRHNIPQIKGARILDVDNDGNKDILVETEQAPKVILNRGADVFDDIVDLPDTGPISDLTYADLNEDGVLEIFGLNTSRQLSWLSLNSASVAGKSMSIKLNGVRSAPDGRHTQVEVRHGGFYSKYQSEGEWLHLPVASADYAEILRIIWPNGFVENKFKVDAGRSWEFEESERISGSCPSVYAVDGENYNYITDAFISGPMGVPMGPGRYFPVGNDEYVKIPGQLLKENEEGKVTVSIVEELREVTYIDQVQLLAVDRPIGREVFPNEYLLPNEFPAYAIHLTSPLARSVGGRDHTGEDVTDLISAVDYRYPHNFSRSKFTGFSSPHGVDLELTPEELSSNSLRLFLTGWFYYFDSTSLMAASQQAGHEFIWPQIQVMRNGQWEFLRLIGIPSGKEKTVVVDLGNGAVPADAEAIRIWSNVELYWDRIMVDTGTVEVDTEVMTSHLQFESSRLRFHGFSELLRPESEFPMPDRFDYHSVSYRSMWNPLSGRYTRYGNVDELVVNIDDKMAVFGSGDELNLTFDATSLPKLKDGYARDYLLYLNGYVKDGDRYTAFAGQTEPLPFQGLPSYPYSDQDWENLGPKGEEYLNYINEYQTRKPLRFDRPDN